MLWPSSPTTIALMCNMKVCRRQGTKREQYQATIIVFRRCSKATSIGRQPGHRHHQCRKWNTQRQYTLRTSTIHSKINRRGVPQMRRRTLTTVGPATRATVLSAATFILVVIIRIIFLTLVGMAGLERTVTVAEAGVPITSEDVIQNSKVVLNDYMSETSSHESTILMDAA